MTIKLQRFSEFVRKKRQAVTEENIKKEISDASVVIIDGGKKSDERQQALNEFVNDILNIAKDNSTKIIAMAVVCPRPLQPPPTQISRRRVSRPKELSR